ncbi:MAG: hypothetical protein ACP5G2_06480 [Candidatus Bipolaricaulaceae bacterium]
MNIGKSAWLRGVVVLAAAALVSAAGLGSMAVAPLSLRIPTVPGERGSATFTVRNTGAKAIQVNIFLHDWWRTPEGKFQILPAGTLDRSCAPWVVYSATNLQLAAGDQAQVTVQVTVPEEAEGDHWALLLVQEQPQPAEERAAEEGLTSTTRVVVTYAVKILQEDPVNESPDAAIQGIAMAGTDPLELHVEFANTGNAHLTAQGTVEIRDIFGDTVKSFTVDPFPVLPGEERTLVVQDTSGRPLEPGLYYAIALFDFGGDYLIQGGAPIEIAPETAGP